MLVMLAGSVQAATYYMTISGVSLMATGPYAKDQYSIDAQIMYSAPSGISATNCRAKVSSLPSGWAVLDDFNTNYKTLATCTGSTTFEIMPTTAGTFSGSDIIVEITGSDSSGQNTLNPATSSPSGTLVVESQPVLDLTILSTSNTSINNTNDTITVTYQVTNTGSAGTSSTSNLRLTVSSTPFNSVLFDNGLTSLTIGTGTLAPGAKVTGVTTLVVSNTTTSNTPSYTLTANADNTVHRSSSSASSISCQYCISALAVEIALTSGWNLISIPIVV